MIELHGMQNFDKPKAMRGGFSRREWLRIGSLSSLGISLSQLLASQANATGAVSPAVVSALQSKGIAGSFGKAKRCIVLFMLGGPPQHETWDPKPESPAEVRGEFKPIATATPGLHIGELMPLTAKLTNHIAVLRALATDDNAHSASGYWMLTGQPHSPRNAENSLPGPPNDWPCMAAVVRHLKGDAGALPGSIRLPEEIWNTGRLLWPGQDAGWLGSHADPWLVTCDPNAPEFRIPDIALPAELTTERFSQRRSFLAQLNRSLDKIHAGRIGKTKRSI
jgi:hypothetical protein